MRLLTLLVTVVVLAVGIAPAPAADIDPAYLITPGVGIGPLRVGMNITDAVSIMGTPKATFKEHYTEGDTITYAWFDYTRLENGTAMRTPSTDPNAGGGLFVLCTLAGQIDVVTAYYAPLYATANGLHTGLTEQQARGVMGEPLKAQKTKEWHTLFYTGVSFRVLDRPGLNGSGTVYLIKVFAPSYQP